MTSSTRNLDTAFCIVIVTCKLVVRNVAQDELDAAEAGKNIGMAILSFISIITLIFYFFVKNALSVIRVRGACRPDTGTQ